MGVRKIEFTTSDEEIRTLRKMLQSSVDMAKQCAQLSMTTDAERELYQQQVDAGNGLLDVLK